MSRDGKFTLDGRTARCDTALGRVLRLLIETAIDGKRWPAGEKGHFEGQFTPPGFVPKWRLMDADVGGDEGGRRVRELTEYDHRATGIRIDQEYFEPAGDVPSKVSMRRIDLSSVPDDIFHAFGLRRPPEAVRRPAFSPSGGSSAQAGAGATPSGGSSVALPGSPSGLPSADREKSPRSNRAEEVRDPGGRGLRPTDWPADPGQPQESALRGQIFFAPHHLEQQIRDSGVPAEQVIPCYAHRDARESCFEWDLRWRYPAGAMIMSNEGRHSPEQLYQWIRRCFLARSRSPIGDRFKREIARVCRDGAVLIYGDHEPETHRGATAVARILVDFAGKNGIPVTVRGEFEMPAAEEATA